MIERTDPDDATVSRAAPSARDERIAGLGFGFEPEFGLEPEPKPELELEVA